MNTTLLSWSEKTLQLLRRMNSFYLPGDIKATKKVLQMGCRINHYLVFGNEGILCISNTDSMTNKSFIRRRLMAPAFIAGSSLEKCLRFEVGGQQVGWIRPNVASVLRRYPEVFCTVGGAVELCPTLDTYEQRTQAVEVVLQALREEAEFMCLKGWRNEKYAVMPKFCDAPLMHMERAATSLFGVKRYGVHVNGFSRDGDGKLSMWLGRRSNTKQTYPGKLDNLAAGGLAAGCSVKYTLVKECEEEACIPPTLAEKARPVGTISYTYEDDEGVFPECQFVFDLELPIDFKPQIGDGEVQEFYFYPIDKVKELVISKEFKPNCAMVVLDFLIRHSVIEPDSEPFYQEFVAGLHRSL